MWKMTRTVAQQSLDLLFFPSVDSYFFVTKPKHRVVTIHDVIPELYPDLTVLNSGHRFLRRAKVCLALRQAEYVLTGSTFMQEHLQQVFKLPKERIGVVPYGADSTFGLPTKRSDVQRMVSKRHGFTLPYLLYVGDNGPHKNLGVLISSFRRLKQKRLQDTLSLVIISPEDSLPPGINPTCAKDNPGEEEYIYHLGFQPDNDLKALYQGAEALIVPSIMEGFGLPGIEAVSCGTPIIATTESPLPELLGGAVIAVGPKNEQDIEMAMISLLEEQGLAQQLRHSAIALSEKFRWSNSAEQLIKLFRLWVS
ncbi:glycosyl transferase group 1 [Candidatus Scalindua japonica]|uniref:Glycosyl transferase group 1 n=2 Tax=Candidatus Scalindua japonica TaxID=1284222 RepID=A0A286TX25_9BACT|nr:glycosyl transferase group 1 [Candidatus Scalindua japonica]